MVLVTGLTNGLSWAGSDQPVLFVWTPRTLARKPASQDTALSSISRDSEHPRAPRPGHEVAGDQRFLEISCVTTPSCGIGKAHAHEVLPLPKLSCGDTDPDCDPNEMGYSPNTVSAVGFEEGIHSQTPAMALPFEEILHVVH